MRNTTVSSSGGTGTDRCRPSPCWRHHRPGGPAGLNHMQGSDDGRGHKSRCGRAAQPARIRSVGANPATLPGAANLAPAGGGSYDHRLPGPDGAQLASLSTVDGVKVHRRRVRSARRPALAARADQTAFRQRSQDRASRPLCGLPRPKITSGRPALGSARRAEEVRLPSARLARSAGPKAGTRHHVAGPGSAGICASLRRAPGVGRTPLAAQGSVSC